MPILDGHTQPGPDLKRCYGCGGLGHVRGDPKCAASSGAVWKGAPEGFKKRIEAAGKNLASTKKGGKEKGVQHNGMQEKESRRWIRQNCHATTGPGAMASANMQMHADTAMPDQKGEVQTVLP